MKKIILALTVALCAASFAAADTIYLRDGRTIHGTLLGFINGSFVVRVEPRYTTNERTIRNPDGSNRTSPGEIQYFRPNEVDRIEIDGRALDEARFETQSVQVTLEPNWIDSGVDLRRGEHVQVSASGVITAGRMRNTHYTPPPLRVVSTPASMCAQAISSISLRPEQSLPDAAWARSDQMAAPVRALVQW